MAERYKVFEELDHHGVHVVLKGYDMESQGYVTIKQLLTREEADDISEERMILFKSESERLTRLSHPNLILFHTIINNEHGICVITEMIEGTTIETLLLRGPVDLRDFLQIAILSLDAIDYAHQNEILHRALTSNNIKVWRNEDDRLEVSVLDLAYEHMTEAGQQSELDRRIDPVANLYLAPEQLTGKELGAYTDIYALGCIFYYCLSKKHPFEGTNHEDTIERHLEHRVVRLHELCPHLPSELCDWVMWLINDDKTCRPASAQEALDSLCLLNGIASDSLDDSLEEQDAAIESTVRESSGGPRWNKFLIIGGITVVLLAIGGFLFYNQEDWDIAFEKIVKQHLPSMRTESSL